MDDEVLNTATYYLKQWKERADELESTAAAHNATVTLPESSATSDRCGMMSQKHLDTRTFTRPKKQPMFAPNTQRPFHNETIVMGGGQSPKSSTGINLQIGGLVTRNLNGGALPITMTQSSMQKSLIGDTSPPSSICSSTMDLGGDRLGIRDFAGSGGGGGGSAGREELNGFTMDDVRKEVEMLQNLTFDGLAGSSPPLAAVVNGGDATVLIAKEVPLNETFQNELRADAVNGTFDLIGDEVLAPEINGETMVMRLDQESEAEEQNSTFNLTKLVAKETAAGEAEQQLTEPEEEKRATKKDLTMVMERDENEEEEQQEEVKIAEELKPMSVDEDDIQLEFGRRMGEFWVKNDKIGNLVLGQPIYSLKMDKNQNQGNQNMHMQISSKNSEISAYALTFLCRKRSNYLLTFICPKNPNLIM